MTRHTTAREQTMHATVTALMRARMTDGASLLRVGDGRVDEET